MAGTMMRKLPTLLLFLGCAAFLSTGVLRAHEDPNHAAAESDAVGHDQPGTVGHDHVGDKNGTGHDDNEEGRTHAGPASDHPLSIDPDLGIFTLVVFFLLLGLMQKYCWGPIIAGLKRREDGVAGEIAAAEANNLQAKKLLDDYQRQLERAGDDVRATIEAAKKEAETSKQAILEQAQKAAAAEKEQAAQEISAAKDTAIREISQHSVNMAFRVASDALRREVKPDDHRDLIENAGV